MGASSSEAYERTVHALLETTLKADGLSALESFHRKTYTGKSGQEHEIDVSFEIQVGQLKLLFLVECKEYKRPVGVDDVMAFSYRIHDIGAHKGLLVTTNGFQKGVVNVAKAEGIGLLIVAQGEIVHWWHGLMATYIEFWITRLHVHVADNGRGFTVCGERFVALNETWSVRHLQQVDNVTADHLVTRIVFLLATEQAAFEDSEASGRSPIARGIGGRQLEYRVDRGEFEWISEPDVPVIV